jgi:hypothetical protein
MLDSGRSVERSLRSSRSLIALPRRTAMRASRSWIRHGQILARSTGAAELGRENRRGGRGGGQEPLHARGSRGGGIAPGTWS